MTPKRRVFLAKPAQRGLALLLTGVAMSATLGLLDSRPAKAFGVALQTGMDVYPSEPERDVKLERVRLLGAQFLRMELRWSEIAPANPPAGFDASNPDDSAYHWGPLDRAIAAVFAHGLTPFVDIGDPPAWAQSLVPGAVGPDPAQLAAFAHAFATRYDGSHPGHPWVRYWEVWNEPNASYFLSPQIEGERYVSVETYRSMVNDFAEAIHSVRPDDVVIAGSLFPNGLRHSDVTAIAPLDFTRRMMCVSAGPHPRRTCATQVHADAWSIHPYTTGGPSTRPANPDNVWIQNLGALSSLVRSAQRLGMLVSSRPVQTWVTEFSWDSNPPDPQGVPLRLQQRWVAETLYRSWHAGVSLFSWFSLQDAPLSVSPHQGGMYFWSSQGISYDTPKPAAGAFRFPFVAYPKRKRRVLVWGRTPSGQPGRVQIQWRTGSRWRTFATLNTDGDGIFTATRALPRGASASSALLRAASDGPQASPSFSLHRPPDILVTPFGS